MTQINWARPIKFKGYNDPVRFVSFLKTEGPNNKVVIIFNYDLDPNSEIVGVRNLDGSISKGVENEWDVVNVPEVKNYYVNVYKNSLGEVYLGALHDNTEEAEVWLTTSAMGKNYGVKTISFEVEE